MNNELEQQLEQDWQKEFDTLNPEPYASGFDPFEETGNVTPSFTHEDIFGSNSETTPSSEPKEISSLEAYMLQQYGISDDTEIPTENEKGEKTSVKFNDLSIEEKYEVIAQLNTPDIDESDLEIYQELRDQGITLNEAFEYFKNQGIEEARQYMSQDPGFEVDTLTDEELYFLDMQLNFEDLTEDQIIDALEKAKENEILWDKQIGKLRGEYKEMEENYREAESNREFQDREKSYNMLAQNLTNIAKSTDSFPGIDIELDNEDKNEVLKFLLERDENGQSAFIKLLDNPKELFKIAWLAKKGTEAFTGIQDYYKNEITKRSKEFKFPVNVPKVVTKKSETGTKRKTPMSVDDIWDIKK